MKRTIITTAIVGSLILGAAALPKNPIPSVPEASKSDLHTNEQINGLYGVGVIIQDTKALKKLSNLFESKEVAKQGDKGDTAFYPQDVTTFQGLETKVFYATTDANVAALPDTNILFTGGLTFSSLPEDVETRLIKLMEEQGIKSYEIITL